MKIKDFIDYEQPNEYIVESDRYNSKYSTPVLTAGQSFILGYTNESKGVHEKGPCIIFDDFTTSVHYVDFPFKVKSSAMKILTTKSNADIKYCYYLLLSLSKMPPNHKRQWISTTSEKTYELPSMDKQIAVVKQLDLISDTIAIYTNQIENLDNLVKARFIEMFGDPQINKKGFTKAPMGEYLSLLTDFSSNGSYKALDSGVVMYDEPNYAWMVRTTDLESGDKSSIKYIDEKAYELLSKSKIFGGEIIMNKIGSAGKIYIIPKLTMPASLGRNAFMFRYDERINNIFIYYLLTSDYGQREIQQYVRGAVTKTITKDDARAVLIIVPSLELQQQFADFVRQVDKSRLILRRVL
ncbi:restriction endonuclease subunit S [Holdemanella biformis]